MGLYDERYYVAMSSCGKFADGYYGWDGSLHSDVQIFHEDEYPYKDFEYSILVSFNGRPSLEEARKIAYFIRDTRHVHNRS